MFGENQASAALKFHVTELQERSEEIECIVEISNSWDAFNRLESVEVI